MTNQTVTPDAAKVAAYAAADIGTKNKMRSGMSDAIQAAVLRGDIATAQTLTVTLQAFGPATKASTPVDYAAKVADLRATLVHAIGILDAGTYTLPDGVVRPIGPISLDGTPDVKSAEKMSTVVGRKVGRGGVAGYIFRVLEAAPEGATLTTSQLHNGWTSDIGGTDYPTEGASVGACGAAFKRVLDDDKDTDDYGWTVTKNDAGTLVATLA